MKDAISEVFAALADDTRRNIYEQLLASANGRTATELSESANVSRQAIVKHLQVLERSGLAEPQRDGREVHYYAAAEGTERASKWLIDHAAAWDRRIAALEEKVRRTRTR
ncbi:MAG: metalloregulator ArsR/SmtB family transcription factor [Acidimicrobiales bacterium]|jgi:DNA-binding transcriptional ArsR family regulator